MPSLDDLTPAQWALIAAAVFGPPRGRAGILRPRPSYLPHLCRRLPRLRGVVRFNNPGIQFFRFLNSRKLFGNSFFCLPDMEAQRLS